MRIGQLTIVGVGLIGGSVGLAARARRTAARVVGYGKNEEALRNALDRGALDEFTTDLPQAVAAADLVVVCTPVNRIADDAVAAARALADPRRATITDAGSTKAAITRHVDAHLPAGAAFVGGHPLAGSEKSGVEHARGDLFAGRMAFVTPSASSDAGRVAAVSAFWLGLGCRAVTEMTPEAHDAAVALTSHLPHAVAAGLAGLLTDADGAFAGRGFRDSTRIASGDPELWAAIFEANRDAVLAGVRRLGERLDGFTRLLAAGDRAGLIRWLAEGKGVRDALGS